MASKQADVVEVDEVAHLKSVIEKMEEERQREREQMKEQQIEWFERHKEMEVRMAKDPPQQQFNPPSPQVSVPITTAAVNEQISVQVEHVMRTESHRIRPFSGHQPRAGEVSFEDWSKQIDLLLGDDSVSDKNKRQRILSSLHSPALDLAIGMGNLSAAEIHDGLKDLYGSSANGVRLLQDFFTLRMKPGENATDYLQRLAVQMSRVVKKGGVSLSQENETVFTHFKSTCENDKLRQIMHVKYNSMNIPTVHDLIKEVRAVGRGIWVDKVQRG